MFEKHNRNRESRHEHQNHAHPRADDNRRKVSGHSAKANATKAAGVKRAPPPNSKA